jgi:stage IV sporulation protein A
MDHFNVYKDIQIRTGGEIYIGVVGPVRTGKSTFIKRFMDILVLPNIEDEHDKTRTRDELPQSAAGKTIMTTEPKFIPKEAAHIPITDGIEVDVRLIDCVGYIVDGAAGHIENEEERMVKTPWFEQEIPFTKAAEIGTKKVINEHSTIGIVVTTDASFGEIPRENYLKAEEKTIMELKKLKKPFIVLVNSERPYSDDAQAVANSIEEKYGVSSMAVNCAQLKKEDITDIIERVLYEFPVSEIDFYVPKWVEMLKKDHWLKNDILKQVKELIGKITYTKDVNADLLKMESDYIKDVKLDKIDMANGSVSLRIEVDDTYYYRMLSEVTGVEIDNEYQMIGFIKKLAGMQKEYGKVENAMEAVRYHGYGVVTPTKEEITLAEPTLVKHGNRYGVKIKADAPSVHMIKANIETEIAPIVGSEEQANDLITYIKESAKESEEGIWTTNIFGKSIEQLVEDGMQSKISKMTEESQVKLQDTLQKIVNDSNGGLICIII